MAVLKLVAENIQRHLLELADTMRGDVDEFDAAEVITALWTLKALHDNKVYFKLPGVADWRTIVAPGEDVFERIRREVASVEKQIQQLSGVLSGVDLRSLDSGRLYRAIQQLERLDLQYDALSDPDPLNGTVAIAADAWFERLADLSGKRGDFLTPRM